MDVETYHAVDCDGACDGCGWINADLYWLAGPCPDSEAPYQQARSESTALATYTVVGLVEQERPEQVWIAGVYEGHQVSVDTDALPPEEQQGWQRWATTVDAVDPVHAERVAREQHRYGGVVLWRFVTDLRAGDVLVWDSGDDSQVSGVEETEGGVLVSVDGHELTGIDGRPVYWQGDDQLQVARPGD